ncbi:hypothetical protein HPP92_001491 [Vanilla planifolia]|uniref:Pentatricopeptide repeat-containing protein n=1 Tax=Vanilla planifolia TaxID=51239 RepID=A0A835RY43_VANPL|nr:hypothetical protein HPP92_001491 [Vanilla planifolia]
MKVGVFACSIFECSKGVGLSKVRTPSGYIILRLFSFTCERFAVQNPSIKRFGHYSDPKARCYCKLQIGLEHESMPRNVFVRSIAYIVQKTDRWDALLKGLNVASACEITPPIAVQVLKRIKKPEVAFKFFTWLGEHEGFSHDSLSYSAIIKVLTKDRSPSHAAIADSLLHTKIDLGLGATEGDYDLVLQQCVSVGRSDAGLSLLNEMIAHGFSPSVNSCRSLLEGLFHSKRENFAWQLFEHILNRKITAPHPDIFNVAMKKLCIDGRLEDALELFSKMKSEDYKPNLDSFNILIKGCCEKGEMEGLCGLFKGMLDINIKPDSYTMNLLINVLCKQGKPEYGNFLFNHMRRVGWIDRKFVYAQLVESLCSYGWWLKALKIFVKMVRRGHHPKPSLYNSLLRHLCLGGRVKEAYKLKDLTLKKGVLPGIQVYYGLINGLCLSNRMDLVEKLLEEIKNHRLLLNPQTCNIVLRGYCMSRNAKSALGWVKKLKGEGFKPDQDSFDMLLSCLSSEEKVNEAMQEVVPKEERISCVISELVKSNNMYQVNSN